MRRVHNVRNAPYAHNVRFVLLHMRRVYARSARNVVRITSVARC